MGKLILVHMILIQQRQKNRSLAFLEKRFKFILVLQELRVYPLKIHL